MSERSPLSPWKKATFVIIAIVTVIASIELISSYVLLLRLRITDSQPFTKTEPSYLSAINIPYKAAVKAGLFGEKNASEKRLRENEPSPRNAHDPELGYRPKPATYRETYLLRRDGRDEWERLRIKHTRRADGTRWTGKHDSAPWSTVYLFGDSLLEGMGVNDEQTFSYLLQQERRDLRVRLFAVRGYGMSQSFILFNRLRNEIGPNDVIILGYGDTYDVRNAVAPSWLRVVQDWHEVKRDRPASGSILPKASIDAKGAIQISHVPVLCSENEGYCERKDPPREDMSRLTAALVNDIAKNTDAKTILLHLKGDKENPALDLIDDRVTKVSALPDDFDSYVRDSVEDFDGHPGPYWHYAISRKLLELLDGHRAAGDPSRTEQSSRLDAPKVGE